MLSYLQAIIMGVLQGFTELFPISSLGHSVVIPKIFGWDGLVRAQSQPESFFLAFLVGLHVATAIALLIYFREDWKRIIAGFFRTLKTRKIETSDERVAWLLVVATIPAGLMGLLLEHAFRVVFAKPLYASIFLIANGFILLVGETYRRRAEARVAARSARAADERPPSRRLETLGFEEAAVVGTAQVFALLAGISRSGITMVAGLVRGMDYEDAARFSFLLATPIILAAGVYKLPDLVGPDGKGIFGQVLVGSLFAGVTAYLSVRFLMRYFTTNTLLPFAIYCLIAGTALTIGFAL